MVGEGAQDFQKFGVATCDNIGHGGCRGDCKVSSTPAECTAALFFDAFGGPAPAVVTDCLCRITPNIRRICFVLNSRGPSPVQALHRSDSPAPRDFAFALVWTWRGPDGRLRAGRGLLRDCCVILHAPLSVRVKGCRRYRSTSTIAGPVRILLVGAGTRLPIHLRPVG